MAYLDPHLGNFSVAGVHRFNYRRAYRAFFVAGVIDDQLLAWLHFTQMPHRHRIGHAVPDGGLLFLQISEAVNRWFGFEEVVHFTHPERSEGSLSLRVSSGKTF